MIFLLFNNKGAKVCQIRRDLRRLWLSFLSFNCSEWSTFSSKRRSLPSSNLL